MNNRTLQNTKGEQKNIITIAAAPAAHTSYLSSPPAAILHEKAQSVVLWLSPQHNPHATFMQPLQCVSRHHVSNPHVWTHIGNKSRRQSCSHSSAICNRRFQNTLKLHTHAHKRIQSSFKPPSGRGEKNHQNGRPPTAADTHTHTPIRTRTRPRAHAHAHAHAHARTRTCARATRTHAHAHTRARAHTRTRAHARTRTRAHAHTRTRAHAHTRTCTHAHTHTRTHAHTRYLSSPPAATFHGKTQGFVLRLPLQPKSHATFMQPLHCVLYYHVSNPHVSTHGNKTRHQSCSHFTAICNQRFQNTR